MSNEADPVSFGKTVKKDRQDIVETTADTGVDGPEDAIGELPDTGLACDDVSTDERIDGPNWERAAMKNGRKNTRVDDAYELLKREILENRLPPGFQVPEQEVAMRLDMSRTPVREALVRLHNEGLIELVPRRGIRVVPIAPNDMRDIYQILKALEPEAAAEVAERGLSTDQVAKLEAATSDMERALKAGDLDTWATADDRFHRTLLSYCRNGRLTAFLNTLFDQAHRARMITLRLREVPKKSTSEHRAILKAIVSGNTEKTREVFRSHRERSATELVKLLENARLTQL